MVSSPVLLRLFVGEDDRLFPPPSPHLAAHPLGPLLVVVGLRVAVVVVGDIVADDADVGDIEDGKYAGVNSGLLNKHATQSHSLLGIGIFHS